MYISDKCAPVVVTEAFGHANISFYTDTLIGGRSTISDPGLATGIAGHIFVYSREVLRFLGYMDTRFGQYGHEHTDMSLRALRAGYGGYYRPGAKDNNYLFLVINSAVKLEDGKSNADRVSLERNGHLLWDLEKEPIYRLPWTTDNEMREFRAEIAQARGVKSHLFDTMPKEFDAAAYLARYDDVRKSGMNPLFHYVRYGFNENRS
jgi:hypothetical protein